MTLTLASTPTAVNPQLVPAGATHGFFELIFDKNGQPIENTDPFQIPEIIDIDWKDTRDAKEVNGTGAYALSMQSGHNKVELKIKVAALTGKMLNAMYFGNDLVERQKHMYVDKTGTVVDAGASRNVKIQNLITFNLSTFSSHSAIKINGVAATLVTDGSVLQTGEYARSGSVYSFSTADRGKTFELTYVSNGTTVVSTGKIPYKCTYNPALVSNVSAVKKNATTLSNGTAMTRTTYSNLTAPLLNYFMSNFGVVILNASFALTASTNLNCLCTVDGVAVTSVIGTLPTADYVAYIDPPSYALFASDEGVILSANAGTAMTGVAVGDPLTKVGSGTPTSGQYKNTGTGLYTFAAADVGDTVTVSYLQDYIGVKMPVPEDGTFLKNWGVRTQGGLPLTKVPLVWPLAIAQNQYAVDENSGTYYFDFTNNGDKFFVNYEYDEPGGATINVENIDVGKSPTGQLILHTEQDGEKMTFNASRAKLKGLGVAVKTDPSQMEFDFMIFADRKTGVVYSFSTSS